MSSLFACVCVFSTLGGRYFCGVSGHTGYLLAQVLEDASFVKKFLAKNHANLRKSYQTLTKHLREAGIDYLPADAGMFCWIDMQKHLKERSFQGEMALWEGLARDAKVLFTPGKDCHAREPGFFRICFAWMPEQALKLAVDRVKRYIEKNAS